jgi:hypothetical protein
MVNSHAPFGSRAASALQPWIVTGLVLVFLGAAGWLGTTTPHDVPDTGGYRSFDFRFPQLLAQPRSVGYPVYLESHRRLFGSERWVGWGHAVLYAAAAVFFSCSLQGSPAVRFAVLVGLLGSNIFWLYAGTVATDTFAAAAGLTGMGFSLRLSHRWTLSAAAGACLSVSAAWLIRPAMLAIVPAAIVSYGLLNQKTRGWGLSSDRLRLGTLLGLPLVLFCLLRLVTVGEFGSVSFAGYSLMGIVGQFPAAESVRLTLPEADRIREEVARLRLAHPLDRDDLPPLNYTRMEANYNTIVWQWYAPAADKVCGNDYVKANSVLLTMAREMLLTTPREYAIWLLKAFRQAVRQTLDDLAESPFGLLGFVLLGVGVVVRRSWPSPAVLPLVQMGLVYWLCLVAVTIGVVPPHGRLTDAAAVFLTPALLACAVDVWGQRTTGETAVNAGNAAT